MKQNNQENRSECVDIVIPSKDRAIQLHLLLESMSRHLKGMGRITITWQVENLELRKGYELLKSRIEESDKFLDLRNNSKSIIWVERKTF